MELKIPSYDVGTCMFGPTWKIVTWRAILDWDSGGRESLKLIEIKLSCLIFREEKTVKVQFTGNLLPYGGDHTAS